MKRPALLNKKLIRELKALASLEDPYSIITGKTMCTNDFYEGLYISWNYDFKSGGEHTGQVLESVALPRDKNVN